MAVIGTGSSAIQIVPQMQKGRINTDPLEIEAWLTSDAVAEHVTAFMRSVTWSALTTPQAQSRSYTNHIVLTFGAQDFATSFQSSARGDEETIQRQKGGDSYQRTILLH